MEKRTPVSANAASAVTATCPSKVTPHIPISASTPIFRNNMKQPPGTVGSLVRGDIVANDLGSSILLQRSLSSRVLTMV